MYYSTDYAKIFNPGDAYLYTGYQLYVNVP